MTTASVNDLPARAPLAATVNRDDLLAALRTATHALAARPSMPILSGVLIEAHRGKLTLSCTNFDLVASAQVNAPQSRGAALVAARALAEKLAVLPKKAKIKLTGTTETLTLTCGEVTYRVPLMVLEDYPTLPEVAGETLFTDGATSDTLRRFTDLFASCGRDDTLPMLTGIRIEVTDGCVNGASTDRYRLGVLDNLAPAGSYSGQALIPARALQLAIKAVGKLTVPLNLLIEQGKEPADSIRSLDGGKFHLIAGGIRITGHLLDATFPPVRSLMPAADHVSAISAAIADPAAFATAVRQAAVAGGRHTPVRVDFTAKTHTLRCGSNETYDEYAEVDITKQVTFTGEPVSMAFSPHFLLDGLACFGDNPVVMGSSARDWEQAHTKPAVFTSDAKPGYTYLLMPVRMPSN